MKTFRVNDFSAGWTPSDDAVNGRRNGLLVMDNLELDRNGALSLAGGISTLHTGYSAGAHDLFSRFLNGVRHDYAALADGSVYRDAASIITGGNAYITAFGTAFNYTLIASGTQIKKDDGVTLTNLGVTSPTRAPIYVSTTFQKTPTIPALSSLVDVLGTHSTDGNYLKLTYSTGGVAPNSANRSTIQSYAAPSVPLDWSVFPDSSTASDDDYMLIDVNNLGTVSSMQTGLVIDILLVAPDAVGTQVTDYYSYRLDTSTIEVNNIGGDKWNLRVKRSSFVRVGSGGGNWSAVYGVRVTANCDDTTRAFVELYPYGDTTNTSGFCFIGGTASQDKGFWQFAQMNVNNTGSYLAKSALGEGTGFIKQDKGQTVLNLETPTDSQVNEVWVFARSLPPDEGGSALEQWTRVAIILKTDFGTLASTTITLSVSDALAVGIFANTNLVSVQSITSGIINILGPISGRWYYFTNDYMYPSDEDNPDAVNTSLAIRISGSSAEQLMWAIQIAESVILVGTSVDIYILTGTFNTLPDGTIDIYYRGLGSKFPPFTHDVSVENGAAYYYASDGWRSLKANGENVHIVAPNIDRLFRNEASTSTYGYLPATINFKPGFIRSPITMAQGKMWACSVQTNRIDVYDFVRQYWRPYGIGNIASPLAITTTQDGNILLFTADNKLLTIDIFSSKLVNSANGTWNLLTPVFDDGTPYQRKDSYTLKIKCFTGTQGTFNIGVILDDGTFNYIATGVSQRVVGQDVSGPYLLDVVVDISALAKTKNWQFKLTGTTDDLILTDIAVEYELRPVQTTFIRLLPSNFGSPTKKRLRTWPLVIDTLGHDVLVAPYTDNTLQPTFTLNNSYKKTELLQFITDEFGVDYELVLLGQPTGSLFEFYEAMQPEIVQVLPIARRFDQVGPEELFKYGKIKQFELRVYPNGGTSIPYTMYFNDNSKATGNILVINQQEASYFVGLPKGNAGGIVRVELGPTGFDFHRYYMRFQVAKSGRGTDGYEWVTLPTPPEGA